MGDDKCPILSNEVTLFHRYEVEKMLRKARHDALTEAARIVRKRGKQLLVIGTTPSRKQRHEEYCGAYKDAANCIEYLLKDKT